MKRYSTYKITIIILVVVLCVLSLASCSSSDKIKLPSKANDEQKELINYIIKNGVCDDEEHSYRIVGTPCRGDNGIYTMTINYDIKTSKLLFMDMFSSRGGFIIAYLGYDFGAKKQEVLVNIEFNGETISVKGTIDLATYSPINTRIHAYEATYEEDSVRFLSEQIVLRLLKHAQLMLEDLEFSLESFGFENFESN